ncbi:MAG: polysaccharide pyruvyl transferase family protein [Syntrophales bacterium]|jgi:polysaccharide pyruvyl transferase WcaK-like protein
MAYNVCLMGASLETGNMGVSALAVSLIKNILNKKPDASISLLIGNRTAKTINLDIMGQNVPIKVVNYRLSPRARVREHLLCIFLLAALQRVVPFRSLRNRIVNSSPWLKALREADFIGDIHGGDSFSDIYGLIRFFIEALPNFIVFLMKKKLVLLPQTYGPYNHPISSLVARQIMQHSFIVFARDKESAQLVREMIGDQNGGHQIVFCPDVAFTLHIAKVDKPEIEPQIDGILHLPLIGINVNGLMYNGGYTRDNMFRLKFDYKIFVNNLVKRLLTETDAHILFVPHTFGPPGNINSDPDACRDVFQSIIDESNGRLHLLTKVYNQSEIKNIIGLCDFFIGSRMHACIAALSQTIPTTSVAYSKKFSGVFESMGVKDMSIDAREADMDIAIERILDAFNRRDEIKMALHKNLDAVINQIQNSFEEIL